MYISEVSIRRPVLAIVLSVVIDIFGVVGFYFLPIREYPAVDPPIITVDTRYSGASPEVNDLHAHCARNLARYKCPVAIQIVPELPHSAIGKVRKGALRRPEPQGVQ